MISLKIKLLVHLKLFNDLFIAAIEDQNNDIERIDMIYFGCVLFLFFDIAKFGR